MYDWLQMQRAELNRKWPGVAGEDLTRMQGEARQIDRLIGVIEKEPIKDER